MVEFWGGFCFYGFNFLTVPPHLPPTKYFSMNSPQSCYLILEFQVERPGQSSPPRYCGYFSTRTMKQDDVLGKLKC